MLDPGSKSGVLCFAFANWSLDSKFTVSSTPSGKVVGSIVIGNLLPPNKTSTI